MESKPWSPQQGKTAYSKAQNSLYEKGAKALKAWNEKQNSRGWINWAEALKVYNKTKKGLQRGRTGCSPKKAYSEAERTETLKKPTARPNGPKP